METVSRTKKYLDYMKYYEKLYLLKDKTGNYVYTTTQSMFNKKKISSGIEGTVYKSNFKNKTGYLFKRIRSLVGVFAIKTINLKRIQHKKIIHEKMLNTIPENVYKLFYSTDSYNKPSLIEIISNTLTNQLVFQKICPHYILNYNWDYHNNKIRLYNEYATYGDFYLWSKKEHSDELWYNALFQIMIGLLAIKRYFNMIHTDFHLGNILVNKVTPGGYWIYKIDGRNFYLPNLGFVFLLSDFGFSWIPNKLQVPWHYTNTLCFITARGRHFYDILTFIKSLKKLQLPQQFSKTLFENFKKNDTLVFKKVYYQKLLNYYKGKSHHKSKNYNDKIKYYNQIVQNYSKYRNVKNDTLVTKIFDIFYNKYKYKNNNGKCIEKYSLDKRFVKNKLNKVFQKLIT
jgi:hypothetical protein